MKRIAPRISISATIVRDSARIWTRYICLSIILPLHCYSLLLCVSVIKLSDWSLHTPLVSPVYFALYPILTVFSVWWFYPIHYCLALKNVAGIVLGCLIFVTGRQAMASLPCCLYRRTLGPWWKGLWQVSKVLPGKDITPRCIRSAPKVWINFYVNMFYIEALLFFPLLFTVGDVREFLERASSFILPCRF